MRGIRCLVGGALVSLVLAVPGVAGALEGTTYPLPTPPTTTTVTGATPSVAPATNGTATRTPVAVLGETVERPAAPAAVAVEATTRQPASTGALPFTGADVAGLAGIGLLALVVGVFLVRRSRSHTA